MVLIDTDGHKAIDVFYVQSQGATLPPQRARQICAELERACEGPAE